MFFFKEESTPGYFPTNEEIREMLPESQRPAFDALQRHLFIQRTGAPLCCRCETIISEGDYCSECRAWLDKELSGPTQTAQPKTLWGYPIIELPE